MPFVAHSSTNHSDLTDLDLLLALQQDEEWALDELIRRKARPLVQHVVRILGDREDSRDVVQLTFVRVWEHRDRFDRRWSVNTWVYRIASNLAIDFLRSRQSKQRQLEPVRHHFSEAGEIRQRREMSRLDREEVERILRELAGGLTEKQRQVFLLREMAGLNSREVSQIVGCRESTVRNHLFAARKVLRAELVRRFPEYLNLGGAPAPLGEAG